MSAAAPCRHDPGVFFAHSARHVQGVLSETLRGRVTGVEGLTVTAGGLAAPMGALCAIQTRRDGILPASVSGLRGSQAILSVFGETGGIAPGDVVECVAAAPSARVGLDLLGRVLDAEGTPLDGRPRPRANLHYPLYASAPAPLERRPVDAPLGLGVRVIDALLTAGRGQRLGIFAGTGVGKSVLMGMICRHTQADVNVVCLVGERGREVGDFISRQLGPEGLRRSVVIACTSDAPASLRVQAGFYATSVAEFLRDQGCDVLLMMDSITRMALAQRQIGLASGEPPATKGYPPSAFAMLPRLLERAGRTARGSITGIYTVLVEGGDIDEPLADAVRGILDGHVWLARPLANRGHFPAVDVLGSISRVADDVTSATQQADARAVRGVLATWKDIEDLVNIGAYVPGASAEYDLAVRMRAGIDAFLRQARGDAASFEANVRGLRELAVQIEQTRAALGAPRSGAEESGARR